MDGSRRHEGETVIRLLAHLAIDISRDAVLILLHVIDMVAELWQRHGPEEDAV